MKLEIMRKNRNGSEAAYVALAERNSASWRTAELPWLLFAGEFCSHFGQKETFFPGPLFD